MLTESHSSEAFSAEAAGPTTPVAGEMPMAVSLPTPPSPAVAAGPATPVAGPITPQNGTPSMDVSTPPGLDVGALIFALTGYQAQAQGSTPTAPRAARAAPPRAGTETPRRIRANMPVRLGSGTPSSWRDAENSGWSGEDTTPTLPEDAELLGRCLVAFDEYLCRGRHSLGVGAECSYCLTHKAARHLGLAAAYLQETYNRPGPIWCLAPNPDHGAPMGCAGPLMFAAGTAGRAMLDQFILCVTCKAVASRVLTFWEAQEQQLVIAPTEGLHGAAGPGIPFRHLGLPGESAPITRGRLRREADDAWLAGPQGGANPAQ